MSRFGYEWQAAVLSLCVQACAYCVLFSSRLPHEHLFKHIHYCDNRLNLQFTICLNNINLHATFYYYCLALSEIPNHPNIRWRDNPCTWHHLFYYTHTSTWKPAFEMDFQLKFLNVIWALCLKHNHRRYNKRYPFNHFKVHFMVSLMKQPTGN